MKKMVSVVNSSFKSDVVENMIKGLDSISNDSSDIYYDLCLDLEKKNHRYYESNISVSIKM